MNNLCIRIVGVAAAVLMGNLLPVLTAEACYLCAGMRPPQTPFCQTTSGPGYNSCLAGDNYCIVSNGQCAGLVKFENGKLTKECLTKVLDKKIKTEKYVGALPLK